MKNLGVLFTPHPPVILPEVGNGKEKQAIKTIEGLHLLGKMVGEIKPDTIIYITPHGNSFNNGTCILDEKVLKGDFSDFGHKDIKFCKEVDKELTEEIFYEFEKNDLIAILMNNDLAKKYNVRVTLDHGVMVPMYFIDQYYKDYKIVHITPGFTPLDENYRLGQKIKKATKDKSVLVVCSGDLSHALLDDGPYKYHPSGLDFDQQIQEAISNSNPMLLLNMPYPFVEEAAQCGLRSYLMGFGFLDGHGYRSEILSYEGPFGVGYLTGYLRTDKNYKNPSLLKALDEQLKSAYEEKKSKEDDYIKLARMSIETYITTHKKLDFNQVKEQFAKDFIEEATHKKSGAFVSLHLHGRLRGCIGTIHPVQDSLIEEIMYNSIDACSQDPRFNEVEPRELLDLDIKVDVLEEPELIASKEGLDVKKYGVIVEKGLKRGLLLPNLEGVNTIEEQVDIAMQKAGIQDENGVNFYRFKVIRHER